MSLLKGARTILASPNRRRRFIEAVSARRSERGRARLRAGGDGPRRRGYFFAYRAGRYTPVVAVDTDLGLLLLSSYDRGKQRELFAQRRLQADAFATAIELAGDRASRDGVLVDVGAHIGLVTLSAVRIHGFRRALCVEAEPANRRLLRANLAMNAFEADLRVASAAASDHRGTATLTVNPTMHGKHSIRAAGNGGATVEVPMAPLDDLIGESGFRPDEVTFVKVDTEGHEPEVLGGASTLLERSVPTMIEFAPLRYEEASYRAMVDRVAAHYNATVDLRTGSRAKGGLDELHEIYNRDSGPRVTDVLLLP